MDDIFFCKHRVATCKKVSEQFFKIINKSILEDEDEEITAHMVLSILNTIICNCVLKMTEYISDAPSHHEDILNILFENAFESLQEWRRSKQN